MTQNDMSELIQRKDVIKAMGEIHPMDYNKISLLERIQQIPAVDSEPVRHGRWELVDEAEPRRYGCSECSCLSWYGTYKYCPNCGANMDGEEW